MALISTLVDDFNTGVAPDAAKWTFSDGGTAGFADLDSGKLRFNFSGTGAYTGDNFLTSVDTFDLNESAVYARLVTPAAHTPVGPFTQTAFFVSGTSGFDNFIGFVQNANNELYIIVRSQFAMGSDSTATFTYSPTNHAWMRIRCTSGTLYFEAAPTTAANPPSPGQWNVLYSVPASDLGWSVSDTRVQLNARHTSDTTYTPSSVEWDGVNTASGFGPVVYSDIVSEVVVPGDSQSSVWSATASRAESVVPGDSATTTMVTSRSLTEAAVIDTLQEGSKAFSSAISEAVVPGEGSTSIREFNGAVVEEVLLVAELSVRSQWERVQTGGSTVWTPV